MTATASPTVKNPEFMSFGLVESASVNSITDFTPSKLKESQANTENVKEDFVNTFICHLIFYAVFCVSLVLYILFDLGFASFIVKIFNQLIGSGRETGLRKKPAFA